MSKSSNSLTNSKKQDNNLAVDENLGGIFSVAQKENDQLDKLIEEIDKNNNGVDGGLLDMIDTARIKSEYRANTSEIKIPKFYTKLEENIFGESTDGGSA